MADQDIVINVKSPVGKTESLKVEKSFSLKQLKRKLLEKEDQKKLKILRLENKILDEGNDKDALAHHHIVDGSTIKMLDGFLIFIKNPDTSWLPLVVHSTDTIQMVKEFIWVKKGVPIAAQMILFDGRRLDDSHTVAQCGIQANRTLFLERIILSTLLTITFCSFTDKTFLTFKPNDTIATVQREVIRKFKEKFESWEILDLYFNGHLMEKLEDTLEQYKVTNNSTIIVYRRLKGG